MGKPPVTFRAVLVGPNLEIMEDGKLVFQLEGPWIYGIIDAVGGADVLERLTVGFAEALRLAVDKFVEPE
jgi:hypothetical protein